MKPVTWGKCLAVTENDKKIMKQWGKITNNDM